MAAPPYLGAVGQGNVMRIITTGTEGLQLTEESAASGVAGSAVAVSVEAPAVEETLQSRPEPMRADVRVPARYGPVEEAYRPHVPLFVIVPKTVWLASLFPFLAPVVGDWRWATTIAGVVASWIVLTGWAWLVRRGRAMAITETHVALRHFWVWRGRERQGLAIARLDDAVFDSIWGDLSRARRFAQRVTFDPRPTWWRWRLCVTTLFAQPELVDRLAQLAPVRTSRERTSPRGVWGVVYLGAYVVYAIVGLLDQVERIQAR